LGRVVVLSVRAIALASVAAVCVANPAIAEDCFPKVRAAAVHAAAPARKAAPHRTPAAVPARPRVHHVRHVVKRPRPKRVQVAAAPAAPARHYAESSFAQRTLPVYLPRPVSCDDKPSPLIQALPPAPEKPPAQVLLDELAGPEAAPPAPETSPDYISGTPDEGGGPFFPGGGVPFGGGPGGGGQPPITPPGGGHPPIVPPDTGPPPPVVPPDTGQPPIILPPGPPGQPPVIPPDTGQPPILPPGDQPPILPPSGPPIQPPGGQPPGVPEPATWAMLILGFFGLGGAIRRQIPRRRAA
jgi:hypothetical protein